MKTRNKTKIDFHSFMSSLLPRKPCTTERPLRKHAYSNTLKILPSKNGNFSDKKFRYFSYFCSKHRLLVLVEAVLTSTQIYVLSRNNKNNVYPCKPMFYYIKVGFKGVKIIYVCFRDAETETNARLTKRFPVQCQILCRVCDFTHFQGRQLSNLFCLSSERDLL